MNPWRSAGDPPTHIPNILVVDDDRRVRELIEHAPPDTGDATRKRRRRR